MASVYLSPFAKKYALFHGGGFENEYMKRIADHMEHFLQAASVPVARSGEDMTSSLSVAHSNEEIRKLHVAIRTGTGEMGNEGGESGACFYYYAGSETGRRAAEIFAKNYKTLYPDPQRVRTVSHSSFAELKLTRAPAVYIVLGYRDHPRDAAWIKDNSRMIAANLALSAAEFINESVVGERKTDAKSYLEKMLSDKEETKTPIPQKTAKEAVLELEPKPLDVFPKGSRPFGARVEVIPGDAPPKAEKQQDRPAPQAPGDFLKERRGRVDTKGYRLNLRTSPSPYGRIIGEMPDGAPVDVFGVDADGWCAIRYQGIRGYARTKYIHITE